jgi:hypothetical protein
MVLKLIEHELNCTLLSVNSMMAVCDDGYYLSGSMTDILLCQLKNNQLLRWDPVTWMYFN